MASSKNLFGYEGRVNGFSYRKALSLFLLLILTVSLVTGCSSKKDTPANSSVSKPLVPSYTILKENINGEYSSSVYVQIAEVLDYPDLQLVSFLVRNNYKTPAVLGIYYYLPGMKIETSSYWARADFEDDSLKALEIFGLKKEDEQKASSAISKLNELTVNQEIIGTWQFSEQSPRLIRISKDNQGQYFFSQVFLRDFSGRSRKTRKEGEKYILMAETTTYRLNGRLVTSESKEKESYYKIESDGSLALHTPISGILEKYPVL